MKSCSMELVDLRAVSPRSLFEIRYASAENFLGRKVYPSPKCFLREEVASKVARIQSRLEKRGLCLKIFDAYRPHSVQKIFWEFLPDPRYIGDPKVGSRHNRGAAVDLTLVDSLGKELLMPTPFDEFSSRAHRDYLFLPAKAMDNRLLLEEIMGEENFIPLPTEWWHFDDQYWEHYPVEDIPFEKLG